MQSSYKFFILAIFFLLLGSPGWADDQQTQAVAAALAFSSIIDQENFQAAYWAGSELLRLANDEQEWIDQTGRAQNLLGKVTQRTLKAVRSVTTYPGLPDDEYVIVYFQASSFFKANAAEVLLVHQEAGLPKVCAYSIR